MVSSTQKLSMPADPESGAEKSTEAPLDAGKKNKKFKFCNLVESEEALATVKFFFIIVIGVTICVTGLHNPNDILRSGRQFKSWYKQYAYQLDTIARNNCANEYSIYLHGTRKDMIDRTLDGAGGFTLFVQPMMNFSLRI